MYNSSPYGYRFARRVRAQVTACGHYLNRRGPPTTGVVRAAGDEVSALTAMQFAGHAEIYQAMSAQAAAIHQQFVDVLAVSADSYAATEAANTVAAR